MRNCLLVILSILFLLNPQTIHADITEHTGEDKTLNIVLSDSISTGPEHPIKYSPYRFTGTDLIVPVTLISLGIAGLEWKGLKNVNHKVTDALWGSGHRKIKIDNFTEYLPAVATYGLNLCGVKGEHDYVDLTIIMGTAYLMMAAIVYPTKDFVNSPRPYGDPRVNSFPSGHTAWAFTGAEIMRREFWKVSPWIGVSGYLVATGTAFLRLYNGAHWLTDVLAGAGIGILCAEAAYWLYPAITKHLFPKRYNNNLFLSPTATRNSFGVAASIVF